MCSGFLLMCSSIRILTNCILRIAFCVSILVCVVTLMGHRKKQLHDRNTKLSIRTEFSHVVHCAQYVSAIGSRKSKVSGNFDLDIFGFEKHFWIWKTFSDLKKFFGFEKVFRIWMIYWKIPNIFIIIKWNHLRICTVGVVGYNHAHAPF